MIYSIMYITVYSTVKTILSSTLLGKQGRYLTERISKFFLKSGFRMMHLTLYNVQEYAKYGVIKRILKKNLR